MPYLHVPPVLVSWWTRSDGLFPWIENNQGFISLLALGAALAVALIEQGRALAERGEALLAEARAMRRAEEANAKAEANAREADINYRLTLVGEFATAARRLVLDLERALQDDLRKTDEFMMDGMSFTVPEATVMRGAKASAETIQALIPGAHLSPSLILAARQAMAALLVVAEGPNVVRDDNFRDLYESWTNALHQAIRDITQGEMELLHLLRPPEPYAETASREIEAEGHL